MKATTKCETKFPFSSILSGIISQLKFCTEALSFLFDGRRRKRRKIHEMRKEKRTEKVVEKYFPFHTKRKINTKIFVHAHAKISSMNKNCC